MSKSISKNYRKFIASAVAITVVVPMVAPVASIAAEVQLTDIAGHTHETAINALVGQGVINGFPDKTFKAELDITRGDAAVMIARDLEILDGKIPAKTDVTDLQGTRAEVHEAVAKLVNIGKLSGYPDGSFKPYDKVTRGQMAKYIANAYDLTPGDGKTSFPDVNPASDLAKYVDAIADAKITIGNRDGTYGFDTNINRGQFAEMLYRAQKVEVGDPVVESVKAINAKTVELTGTKLDAFKAENFSLEGNKVTGFNVDAKTGKATLTFEKNFKSAQEQSLKLTEKVVGKGDKVTQFKFTYTLKITSVTANALTVDENTAQQKLTFKINGESVDADLEYIKASGYTVEFQSTSNVFVGSKSSSDTGELKATLADGFAYKVVITDKDKNVVAQSPLAAVKIVDKTSIVTAIDSFEITDGNIILASNTIVIGEKFSIKNIVGDKADGTKDTNITSLVEFDSSNKNIAIVDSDGAILPIKSGKTTITVKSGDVAKTFELTVTADKRVAKTATASTSSLKLVEAGTAGSVGLVVKDQYGDVVKGLDFSKDVTYETTKVTVGGVSKDLVTVTGGITNAEGKTSLTVTPVAAGSGTVKVKAGNNVIATLTVSVSNDTVVKSHKLELVDASKDATLDIYTDEVEDNQVQFVYNQYNADGYLLNKETAIGITGTTYTVSVEEATGKDIIDASVTKGVITVTAKKDSGTANLVIKEGSVVHEKKAITVVNSTPTVSAVTLKETDKVTTATEIKADSVLSLKAEAGKTDRLVQDITLTFPSKFAVRLDEKTGNLYLDADNNGTKAATELVVGTVSITETIQESPIGTTIATKAGDKGSVVYSVKNTSGHVIATSVISVDVE